MEQIGISGIFDLSNFDKGIDNYLKSIKRAENETHGMAGKLGKAYDDMSKSVLNAATVIGKTFVAAAAAGALAVGAFVASGISKAADLESQMGAIAAVMGETKDAVGPLKDLILDLGLDPTLKVNAQEAADAIEKLASNGVSMAQIMDGAAKATVLLANATKADFGTAAAIATDAMTLFNIDAANMMEAVDGITGVVNNSKFTINDYQLALAQGGGVASAVGVEFDDFNTAIAGTSALFKSGSDAGTSFKTFLQRLIPQSAEAAGVMKELGLMTAEGSNQFYDAAGNLKDMNEISVLLEGALSGLSEEQKNNALSTIFGADAMRAAVGLAEQGEVAYTDQSLAAKELGVSYNSLTLAMEGGLTKFEALAAQLGSTDAAESAKVRMDNFKGSLEILQGVIDTVALKIGFLFLPMLKQLADRASELITQYAPMIVEFFDSFATGIEKIVSGAGWREVFPVWLTTTIDLVTQNIDILTGALGGVAVLLASAGIAAAFTAIGAAMAGLLSPMALLIGGAAALGIAWNTNFLGLRDTTLAVITAVMGAFAPLTTAIQEFGTGALAEIWAFATGNYLGFASVIAIWNGAVASVQNLFTTIVSAVTTNLPTWIANLTAWGTAMGQWITDAATIVGGQIATWAMSLITTLAANLPLFLATMWGWSASLVSWIGLAIAGTIVKIGEWATALVTWLSGEGQSQVGESTGGLVSALIDWITTDLIPKVGPAMLQFGLALGGAVLNVAAALGIAALSIGGAIWAAIMATDWKTVGTNILTYIKDGWEATKATVLTAIGLIATSFEGKFTEIDWKQVGTNALTFIKDGWEATKTTALLAIGLVATSVKTKFTEIDWKQLGTDALTLIKDGWEFAKTTVLPIIGTIATSLKDKFNETDWKTLGTDTANAIRDGLKAAADLAGGLIAAAGTIATGIKDAFTEKSWSELGTQISNDIKTGLDTAANAVDGMIAQMGTIATDLGNKITATDWQEVGHSIARLIKDGLKAAAEALDGLLAVAGTIVTDVIKKFTDGDWSGTGTSVMDALRDAVKTAAYAASGLIYIVGQIAIGMLEEFTGLDFDTAATTMMNALRDGIKAAAETASGLLAQATTTATDLITKFTEIDWQNDVGKYISDGIRDGITSAVSAGGGLYEIVTGVGASIKKTFTDLAETWKNIGMDIVNGIGAGITAAKDSLIKKAQDLANSLPGWVQEILGISSPSKVFAEIGRNIVEGLIVGMEDKRSALQSTVAGISQLTMFDLMATQFTINDAFSERLKESYIEPLRTTADAVRKRQAELQNTLAALHTEYFSSGSDERKLEIVSLINKFTDELSRLSTNQAGAQLFNIENILQAGDQWRNSVAFLEDQISLMEEAKKVGIDVSNIGVGDKSIENLTRMAVIEKEIARQKQLQLFYTARQIQTSLPDSGPDRDLKNKIALIEEGNEFYSDQLALMKQAENLGLDLNKLWAGGVTDVSARLLNIQFEIANATRQSLNDQMMTMIAEQKRVKGLEMAMRQLQPLIDQTDVSSAFGQKYKAEVLDPMLRALQESAGIDAERVRLMNEYTAAAQKLIEINKKEEQLGFLQKQLDIVKMIADQDLVGGASLFDGIAFGVNASIDDLLLLTNRVLNAMITEVRDELGIHSPSRVFADIGSQMMNGLSQGIQRSFVQPLNALRQSTVAHGAVSTRTLNFAMGGVTINTPMDEVRFESRILRILERSIA